MQDPTIVEYFTKSIDLRDMAEPTETLIGEMTLENYKALSREEIQALIDRYNDLVVRQEEYGNGYGFNLPPQKERYYEEGQKLEEYSELAEYGTTDDDEIRRIRNERKAAEITRLRQERPDFGKVPDDYRSLPKRLRECIAGMFMYFDEMRDPYEEIGIDTYSLGEMGIKDKDLQALKDRGILLDEEAFPTPGGVHWHYTLSQPYYERWVSRHYPAAQ